MSTFEPLNYRERAIVADRLGFCRDCYATHYYDENDLDADGQPKRKPRRKVPFIELAVEHGLASPDTADRTYRRALEKMRKALSKYRINKKEGFALFWCETLFSVTQLSHI